MEEQKFRLGIMFNFNPKWTGGMIYILNIIKTLNFLEDKDKPSVVILYNPILKKYVDEINYPYLEMVPHSFPSVYNGFVQSFLKNKNIFVHDLVVNHQLDAIFPMHDYPVKSKLDAKLVSWIADLQHHYYPQFFTKRKILERNARIRFVLHNSKDLVVSSQVVKDDIFKFFKVPNKLTIHIYHFVSIIEGLSDMTFDEIRVAQAPALTIEILSPTQALGDLLIKMKKNIDHGVKSVWIILPETKTVYIYNHKKEQSTFIEGAIVDKELGIEIKMEELFA